MNHERHEIHERKFVSTYTGLKDAVYGRKPMNIPTTNECYRMLHQMAMPDHIAAHSIRVCQVAVLIANHLNAEKLPINTPLVTAAALLHDITKPRSFKTKENHAQTGGEYLKGRGYPEIGHIVAQHIQLYDYNNSGCPTEAEIVNYADKRVLHDQVVNLDERMAYIVETYGSRSEDLTKKLQSLWSKTVKLERKLFATLRMHPDSLKSYILSKRLQDDLNTYLNCRH